MIVKKRLTLFRLTSGLLITFDTFWRALRLLFYNLHKILANLQNFKYLCNFKLLTKNVQKQIVREILF